MNMNFKPLLVFAKSTLVIVLAMIVMAGATGLSFKAHYCHDRFSGIAFYTEMGLQKPATCGCKEDASSIKINPFSSVPVSLSKNSCCSNVSFFSKLNLETTRSVYFPAQIVHPEINYVASDKDLLLASINELFAISSSEPPPPPISGRKLVLFLCQQRIPSISYCC
jgi:hypothetical protein